MASGGVISGGDRDGVKVVPCDCLSCKNEWFIHAHQDFAPRMCPYCGLWFNYYTDDGGVKRDLAGVPLEEK